MGKQTFAPGHPRCEERVYGRGDMHGRSCVRPAEFVVTSAPFGEGKKLCKFHRTKLLQHYANAAVRELTQSEVDVYIAQQREKSRLAAELHERAVNEQLAAERAPEPDYRVERYDEFEGQLSSRRALFVALRADEPRPDNSRGYLSGAMTVEVLYPRVVRWHSVSSKQRAEDRGRARVRLVSFGSSDGMGAKQALTFAYAVKLAADQAALWDREVGIAADEPSLYDDVQLSVSER
jgi:hypothetical protein